MTRNNHDMIDYVFVGIIIISVVLQIITIIVILVFGDFETLWKLMGISVNGGIVFYSIKKFHKIIERRIEQGGYDRRETQDESQNGCINTAELSTY